MGDHPSQFGEPDQKREMASPPERPSGRAERRALLGTLAAELGHDLQSAFNLFRLTADRIERGSSFDQEDAELLREELARMSAISARLRALSRTELSRQRVPLTSLIERALTNVRHPQLGRLELSVPRGPALHCDAALFSLALAELVQNALEAMQARAGIGWLEGRLLVWDDGPGFDLEFQKALAWGTSSRPNAAGLGLTLAFRAARAHGFRLSIARAAQLTELSLSFPAHDLGSTEGTVEP